MKTQPSATLGTLSLGSIQGIPLRVHIWFLILGGLVALLLGSQMPGLALLYILGGGLSFLLHELGHALSAKRLGYTVDGVVLHPFRAATSIRERLRPEHEWRAALAGPAITLLLVLLLGGISLLERGTTLATVSERLLSFNFLLLGISLLPALPQDAGLALRATLALRRGERAATKMVGKLGIALGIVFLLLAVWLKMPILGLVALMIYTGTISSVRTELTKLVLSSARVEEAMLRHFKVLSPGNTLGMAADQVVAAGQFDFPVVQGDEVLGILRGGALLQGLTSKQRAAYVAGKMDREFTWAEETEPLAMVLAQLREGARLPIVVRKEGQLVGLLTERSLHEFLTLRTNQEIDACP